MPAAMRHDLIHEGVAVTGDEGMALTSLGVRAGALPNETVG